jgi:hypothetical protein
MRSTYAVNDSPYTDDEILAEIGRRAPLVVATSHGIVDAGLFSSLASAVAERLYGALVIARKSASVFIYEDGRSEVALKRARVAVSSAPNADYASHADLCDKLIVNARPCAKCSATIGEHTEIARNTWGTGACEIYDAGLQKASAA